MRIYSLSPLVIFVILLTFQLHSLDAATATPAHDALRQKASTLFRSEKWLELEAWASELRKSQARMEEGQLKLYFVYRGIKDFNLPKKGEEDEAWLAWYEQLSEWEKAVPNSVMLPVVRIMFWSEFGWKGRGGGYAHTVTEEGWKLFRERNEKAYDIYETIEHDVESPYPALISTQSSPNSPWGCNGLFFRGTRRCSYLWSRITICTSASIVRLASARRRDGVALMVGIIIFTIGFPN